MSGCFAKVQEQALIEILTNFGGTFLKVLALDRAVARVIKLGGASFQFADWAWL